MLSSHIFILLALVAASACDEYVKYHFLEEYELDFDEEGSGEDPTDTQTADECVKYDFEEDYSEQFGYNEVCSGISAARWIRRLYASSTRPASPHPLSTAYIAPTPTRISCASSFSFEMHPNGLLQLNVFMQPTNNVDYITTRVYREGTDGQNQLITSAVINRLSANFRTGTNVINITIPEIIEPFQGHILLMGSAASSSVITVDSFSYIRPSTDVSSCVIYEDQETPTSTTMTTATSDECVKYDFEENYSEQFGYNEVCSGISAARWIRRLYASSSRPASPHPLSTAYIAPTPTRISCASSFSFEMHPNGFLQLNVYMQTTNNVDYITTRVYREGTDGQNQLITSAVINRSSANFRTGTNIVNITLPETIETFQGYIVLMGSASSSSIITVDSFRYVAPDTEKDSCIIYEEETQSTTTITESTSSETESITDNTTSICATFQLQEEDFNTFTKEGLCSFFGDWSLTTNNIDDLEIRGESAISPGTSLSCTTSSSFNMRIGGYVEVILYLGTSNDEVTVIVYESIDSEGSRIVNQMTFNESTDNFWHPLIIPLAQSNDEDSGRVFEGYVTFIGRAAEESTVLIDSFRYYTADHEAECQIYEDPQD